MNRKTNGLLMRKCAGCNSSFDTIRGHYYIILTGESDAETAKVACSKDCTLNILIKEGLVKKV